MKPFLGIDITNNKKNEEPNGSGFLSATPTSAMSDALEASTDKAADLMEQGKLPKALRVGQWICGAVGAIVAVGILKAVSGVDGVSFSEAYHNAAWLFWLGGCCLVVWAILKLISMKKENTVSKSEENTQVLSRLDTLSDTIFAELNVPSYAKVVDILSFSYKIKDGLPVPREKGMAFTPYCNFEFKIFADDGNLYLANLEGKYSFPRSSFRAIRTVKKNIRLPMWNKEIGPKEGIYKPHKLTVDNYGCVHVKPYYILELEHGGELWGIYFPNYELSVFQAITGLTAE